MGRSWGVVTFVLVMTVGVLFVAALAGASAAAGPMNSVETPDETETTNPAEPTPTPDDGPDGHADDPFPRWLPVAFVGVLVVGIAAVGGGLWLASARVRRFLGR